MTDISILIPNYNGVCAPLVGNLQKQAASLDVRYEILVADDGSTDSTSVATNRTINLLPCCRYIERKENVGRAAIRNFLASEARYAWLLFIDSDMVVCREDFLYQYLAHINQCSTPDVLFYGGVVIGRLIVGNLRSMYEKSTEHEHTVERRQQQPYHDFHTANFMVPRALMLQYPFDLRFRYYGYEDVLFGKQLQQHNIPIIHIDNPLSFEKYESNADFVSKTEEGLRTLHQFSEELKGYSRLLNSPLTSSHTGMPHLIRLWHRLFGAMERRCLVGKHPQLTIFRMYQLGYFLSIK